jgi:type VI secretion system protein ImpJ
MTVEVQQRKDERRIAGAVELPVAIHWHEGMLLAPQHFQLAAQRNEALAYHHAAAVSPFHWGLLDLRRGPFGEGMVTVRRVEAVMPDGLVITFPSSGRNGDDEGDLTLDLTQYKKDIKEGSKNTVFLAVASHQAGERFAQRYELASKERVPDDTTGKDDLELQVLKPRLQLILADELPSSYSGFPLTRVAWDNGRLVETPYVPPWLRVRAGSQIHTLCRAVAGRLRDTANSLARRVEGESESARETQLLDARMMMHAFVSCLPPFEALLDSGAAHPFTLYLAFASLLGNVSMKSVPPRLDPYDHDNLYPSFETVQKLMGDILDDAVRRGYATLSFRLDGDRFHLGIDSSWADREMVLGIRIPQRRTQEDVHDWVMGSAIGTGSRIDWLRDRRITGIKRERLEEHELIPTAGVVFYEMKRPYGELLRAGEDLIIVNHAEGERRPEDIALYVKNKD